jgi:hypothetical protein
MDFTQYNNAVDAGMDMMAMKISELPPIAVEYAKRLCRQVGGCMEVFLTAWVVYCQIVEHLPCDDSLYLPNADAIKFYAENGYKYDGNAFGMTNEERLIAKKLAIAKQANFDAEDQTYKQNMDDGLAEMGAGDVLHETGEPEIPTTPDEPESNYGTKEWDGEVFSSCYKQCPLFGRSMDGMECGHPSFKGNPDPYANMIISHIDDIQNGFPPKCPLFAQGE